MYKRQCSNHCGIFYHQLLLGLQTVSDSKEGVICQAFQINFDLNLDDCIGRLCELSDMGMHAENTQDNG